MMTPSIDMDSRFDKQLKVIDAIVSAPSCLEFCMVWVDVMLLQILLLGIAGVEVTIDFAENTDVCRQSENTDSHKTQYDH